MARILVPDMLGSTALAVVRSLHRHGDECDLASPSSAVDRALRGRSVSNWCRLPSPHRDGNRYVEELTELCRRGDYDIVIPPTHLSAYLVAQSADRLDPHTRVVTSDAAGFRLANDKLRVTEHARSIGIGCPITYSDSSPPTIDDIAGAVPYPLVVKARGGSAIGLFLAHDERELRAAWAAITTIETGGEVEDHSPLIQEFVPGPIHDACAVAHRGEVINVLTQRRDLMVPISGGVGAVVTTTTEPEVREHAIRLLESLEWTGPAQIEFKYDERDATLKFIELNPRLWGTLAASTAAGMDFPSQLRDLSLGVPVARNQSYRVDLRYTFLFYRGLRAYAQIARAFGVSRIIRGSPRTAHRRYDFDRRDPLPDLHRIAQGAPRFGRELFRAGRPDSRRQLPLELAPLV